MRIKRAFRKLCPNFYGIAAVYPKHIARGNNIFFNSAVISRDFNDFLSGLSDNFAPSRRFNNAFASFNGSRTSYVGHKSFFLRRAHLKKFFHARKTLSNVQSGNSPGMESTHGELCSRLTNGLRGNDANSHALDNRFVVPKIIAIAAYAKSFECFAAQG